MKLFALQQRAILLRLKPKTYIKMKQRTFLLLLVCIVAGCMYGARRAKVFNQAPGRISFMVDEGLASPQDKIRSIAGEHIASLILEEGQVAPDMQRVVATSFASDSMDWMGPDVMFTTVVHAYANHRPLVLSPDMVWLLISQGLSRYVNAHPEQVRHLLVEHEGKQALVVESQKDLLTDTVDWAALIDVFTTQIRHNTKADVAETLLADFSTTGPTERIASGITLMECVKNYFEYVVMRIACGIPSVTLLGTPADWELVLAKAQRLDIKGLQPWVGELKPILQQFVRAAEGQPDQAFWQRMVKKQRPERLEGGACVPGKPTEVDGWLLKLFPDEEGRTLDKVQHTHKMPAEWARVGFQYKVLSPADGTIISQAPMELWAGFTGAKEDKATQALIPQIGWLVRQGDAEADVLKQLQKQAEPYGDNIVGGIYIRVKEVPEVLAKLPHIKSLHLHFTGPVVLPAWMDAIQIDRLIIAPAPSAEEQTAIKARFPNAEFNDY